MEEWNYDLTGEVVLLTENGRKMPLYDGYWGHGGVNPDLRQDSYLIRLLGQEKLFPGQKCKADFRFKFVDDPRFKIEIQENAVIQMFEGGRKIGDFYVEKIFNDNIKAADKNGLENINSKN